MKNRAFLNWLIVLLWVIAIMGFCFAPAFGDESGDDMQIQDDSFGQNYQYTWIPCSSFTLNTSGGSTYSNYNNYRYFTSGSGTNLIMDASINLPSGAYLYSARLYYTDVSSSHWNMYILRQYPDGNYTLLASGVTSGNGQSSMVIYPQHTIQNRDGIYLFRVKPDVAAVSLGFMGVRLYWKRQVRTGLANPFTDIGGLNARFQNAIKALAASGITHGCTATQFCPGSYVTRGEIAVFLAEALGLGWPN